MEGDSQSANSKTPIGEPATISCERCRRRKIKCDRRQPCAKCAKARTECVRGGNGEKQRPVPRSYVQALEGQVASLELFIKKLSSAGAEKRDEMLALFQSGAKNPSEESQPVIDPELSPSSNDQNGDSGESGRTIARSRAGQMRRQIASHSSHFYGGTSLFQIHLSAETPLSPQNSQTVSFLDMKTPEVPGLSQSPGSTDIWNPHSDQFRYYAPHDDVCQRLMSAFFRTQYQYHMCVYREFFLRDYDTGSGRYYSDMLLFAICAMGALVTGDPVDRSLSAIFAGQADALLNTALDTPDLTVLQALLLLGQREVSHCRASRGWIYCGMAFRLAHEMGLHLDPNNWNATTDPDIDREILRRVYWAVFITDKQLSLYFGRPPALYPHESDVRNSVRIPYPLDWEGLLDTYIAPGVSATAYEDGIAFVGAFIYQAELSKIQHSIITELFENRRANADNTAIATTIQGLHVSLTKWLANLPGKLYWNQWTLGQVPSSVLHLHMRFHTTMIILHRPPPHLFSEPETSTSEDVEICFESLQAIFRLMKTFSRYYRYDHLPLDFVHTLSTAASTLLMKRHMENTSWEETNMEKSLSMVLEAIVAIKDVHPCVVEIEKSVIQATQVQSTDIPEAHGVSDFGLIDWPVDEGDQEIVQGDLGVLLTDDILSDMLISNADNYM